MESNKQVVLKVLKGAFVERDMQEEVPAAATASGNPMFTPASPQK
jgi:hypothetical protein